ncbi:helix-turn-helix transcriptional regulator [Dongia sedimenti]|uniref:Helix-turn-helix transcriptional regulator n=1 Tax=Dongia sedimenti TaxID=3064282 RepID=A0ABU0YK61_9PROT|nr:helix-turn-helix transcriptional regulator [Rhodospirillaceae bacterium R-7]
MLSMNGIRAGVDGLLSAAILAEGWEEALMRYALAAGARDAVLMRNEARKTVAAVVTPEAARAAEDFLAGRTPPNSRYQRVGNLRYFGFRIDQDDYSEAELARDPYYQEFLRPNGVFWHANTVLALGSDEYVELSLKRRIELGPYQPADRAVLDSVLPELHAVARIAKGVLDAEARGMTWLLGRRGGAIIELDSHGRVLPGQAAGEGNPFCPVRILRRRLVATDRTAQFSIDRAVAGAISRPGRLGVAALTNAEGRRYLLQVHPVPGRARDIFSSATALALLIERDSDPAALRLDLSWLRSAYGLTDREANVAALLAEGLSVDAIAARLRIQSSTARSYLKNVLQKTGATRQAELVALLAHI